MHIFTLIQSQIDFGQISTWFWNVLLLDLSVKWAMLISAVWGLAVIRKKSVQQLNVRYRPRKYQQSPVAAAYLEPSETSIMEPFFQNILWVKALKFCRRCSLGFKYTSVLLNASKFNKVRRMTSSDGELCGSVSKIKNLARTGSNSFISPSGTKNL